MSEVCGHQQQHSIPDQRTPYPPPRRRSTGVLTQGFAHLTKPIGRRFFRTEEWSQTLRTLAALTSGATAQPASNLRSLVRFCGELDGSAIHTGVRLVRRFRFLSP